MYRSAEDTASLIAVILKRSEQTRARMSAKTIKVLARRKNLRSAFVVELMAELSSHYDWLMSELNSGGFGLVQGKALEAAKPVTASKWLAAAERKAIQRVGADLSSFQAEVGVDQDEPEDDD